MSDETTLPEIFAKDPLDLTDDDIDKTVAFYREQRQRFKLAATQPKPSKTAKPKPVDVTLDLGSLGL